MAGIKQPRGRNCATERSSLFDTDRASLSSGGLGSLSLIALKVFV